jgi:xylan 1,4-beta-xylosidase
MTNYALPRHAIERQSVRVSLSNAAAPLRAGVRRIDAHHANAKALWQARGEPEYLSPELVEELHAASRLGNKPLEMSAQDNGIAFEVVLEPLSVTAVTLTYAGSRVV